MNETMKIDRQLFDAWYYGKLNRLKEEYKTDEVSFFKKFPMLIEEIFEDGFIFGKENEKMKQRGMKDDM